MMMMIYAVLLFFFVLGVLTLWEALWKTDHRRVYDAWISEEMKETLGRIPETYSAEMWPYHRDAIQEVLHRARPQELRGGDKYPEYGSTEGSIERKIRWNLLCDRVVTLFEKGGRSEVDKYFQSASHQHMTSTVVIAFCLTVVGVVLARLSL